MLDRHDEVESGQAPDEMPALTHSDVHTEHGEVGDERAHGRNLERPPTEVHQSSHDMEEPFATVALPST